MSGMGQKLTNASSAEIVRYGPVAELNCFDLLLTIGLQAFVILSRMKKRCGDTTAMVVAQENRSMSLGKR